MNVTIASEMKRSDTFPSDFMIRDTPQTKGSLCTWGDDSQVARQGHSGPRWDVLQWDTTSQGYVYSGHAICKHHLIAERTHRQALQDKRVKEAIDRTEARHLAALTDLATASYDNATEEGLCHDGVMTFLRDHFPEAALPSGKRLFVVALDSEDPGNLESLLDGLDNHAEGVSESYSLELEPSWPIGGLGDAARSVRSTLEGAWKAESSGS